MPRRRALPSPIPETAPARLAALADLLGGESTGSRRFLGGLVIGALAGAALAGSMALRHRDRAGAPQVVSGRADGTARATGDASRH